MYLFLFLTHYMFRAHCAHHQERQIVSVQPLVTVTLCWWPCRVQTAHDTAHDTATCFGCTKQPSTAVTFRYEFLFFYVSESWSWWWLFRTAETVLCMYWFFSLLRYVQCWDSWLRNIHKVIRYLSQVLNLKTQILFEDVTWLFCINPLWVTHKVC